MKFKEYCISLHGLSEEEYDKMFGPDCALGQVRILDLMVLTMHTGMSVSEHADELHTLITHPK